MKSLNKYKGIIPALYAAYDEDGNISPQRVQELAKYYAKIGVKGLYVGGSSGECIYQSVDERKLVLENVMEAVGSELTIIAHIAAPSTQDSIELAQHAEKLNVDALSAIPPLYYRLSDQAVEQYWLDIIEATSTDFFIYNIPSTTGYELAPALYAKMLDHPRVIGLKNSSASVLDIHNFRSVETKESIIFNGVDEQYLAGRLMGADGGIGSTYGVMAVLFMKLDELIAEGTFERAQELQFTITKIINQILACEGSLFDVMKKVLEINEGITVGPVRNPLPRITAADETAIKDIAQAIKEAEEKYIN